MVDLSLASSYIPAFVTMLKCMIFALFSKLFYPRGGLPMILVALFIDRSRLNSKFVIDVNAAAAYTAACVCIGIERQQHGFYFYQLSYLTTCAWTTINMLQLTGRWKLGDPVYAFSLLAVLTSATYAPDEGIVFVATRTFCNVAVTLTQIYCTLSKDGPEEPLAYTLGRNASIHFAPWPAAILVIAAPLCLLATQWQKFTLQQQDLLEQDPESEAAILREALAKTKQSN